VKKNKWEIIYEDDDLMAINKPHGWLSVPDRFDNSLLNIYHSLQEYRDKVILVHRLDKNTSGIMLVAKNENAHQVLNQQFENNEVTKTYVAFVQGLPPEEVFQVDAPIYYNPSKPGQVTIHKSGKESQTKFKLEKRWNRFSKLLCKPITGRMHQIRVHLQYIGNPLMIDPVYSGQRDFYISSIKRKYTLGKEKVERPLLSRQTLHAHFIEFKLPSTNKVTTFEAPIPKDLRALEKQLDKWASEPTTTKLY